MRPRNMIVGGRYNFQDGKERLIYIGHIFSGNGYWHQFTKVGSVEVWCELQDDDLGMIVRSEK